MRLWGTAEAGPSISGVFGLWVAYFSIGAVSDLTFVVVVGLEVLSIAYCDCKPAVLSLIGQGLFAASPVRPVFAFDLALLHLASSIFVHLPPNISGWCAGLASHLRFRGFTEFSEVGGSCPSYALLCLTD